MNYLPPLLGLLRDLRQGGGDLRPNDWYNAQPTMPFGNKLAAILHHIVYKIQRLKRDGYSILKSTPEQNDTVTVDQCEGK